MATARRDLEALSAAGVPVYPQPGRGGGWQLVGGARTDLSGLTAAEAQALFLLAGPAVPVCLARDLASQCRIFSTISFDTGLVSTRTRSL